MYSNTEDKPVKMIDFSSLEEGDQFFAIREKANDDFSAYTKTITAKDKNGGWINATNPRGMLVFIKYDTRVWVRK